MKKIAVFVLLISYSFLVAQENYKYIIVPKKFNFFNQENKYNTSFISKAFFEKEGFKVLYDSDDFIEELVSNRCLALFMQASENNSMFITKINFDFKDCNNKVVYTSIQGTSREKQYEKAYPEAFRTALNSLKGKLQLKTNSFKPIENSTKTVVSDNKIVQDATEQNSATQLAVNQLFAIPTATGYKLVNDKPETIFILKKTTIDVVFMAEKDSKSGVLINKNNSWFFEYYEGDKLLSEKVAIKL